MKITIMTLLCSLSLLATGKFQYIKGEVSISRGGKEVSVSKNNNKILEGDLIRVGESSLAVVILNKKVTIKVDENSLLKIEKNKTQARETSLLMETGSAFIDFFNIDKKGKLQFKTRQAVMGVRGTRFFVSYGTSSKDAFMCVRNGVVEVSTKEGKTVKVKEGEGVKIGGKGISKPKFLPWTAKLNWNLDSKKNLKNKLDISEAYTDPLDFEYD